VRLRVGVVLLWLSPLLPLPLIASAVAGEPDIVLVTKSGAGTIKADRVWEEGDLLCWERRGEQECQPKDRVRLVSPEVLSPAPRAESRALPRKERPGRPAAGSLPLAEPPESPPMPAPLTEGSSILSDRPPMLLPSWGGAYRGRPGVPCATIRSADGTTTKICSEEPRPKPRPPRKPKAVPREQKGAALTPEEQARAATAASSKTGKAVAPQAPRPGRAKSGRECSASSDSQRQC
jgi:hypothetical protein